MEVVICNEKVLKDGSLRYKYPRTTTYKKSTIVTNALSESHITKEGVFCPVNIGISTPSPPLPKQAKNKHGGPGI